MREEISADLLDSLDTPELIWRYFVPFMSAARDRQRSAAVAVVGLVGHLFVDSRSVRAVELVAAGIEGEGAIESLAEAQLIAEEASEFCSFARNANSGQHSAAVAALRLARWEIEGLIASVQNALAYEADPKYGRTYSHAKKAAAATQAGLLRCIFGNPLRPVTFDPAWRTSDVVGLAGRMYDARDFSPMPILADALQDAGCAADDVLNHCRGAGPHVRGCWVVDAVLGRA